MFPFTPHGIISPKVIGDQPLAKVQMCVPQDGSISKCSGGSWGIIVPSMQHSVKTCSPLNVDSNNDVFVSHWPPEPPSNGYVYSTPIVTHSQCNEDVNSVLGQHRNDTRSSITKRTTPGRYYSGDMQWIGRSQATPLRSSGTFSFSESARLCQSCGTRITNSISLFSSQESLSRTGEFQASAADIYVAICSVFWKMSLTFHPYVSSSENDQLSVMLTNSFMFKYYGNWALYRIY